MPAKIGIISQARTTSTRLPNKVFLEAGGRSLLEHHLKRLQWSKLPVIIATTENKRDDSIEKFCFDQNIPCFRGSEEDVLGRFYLAAEKHNLETIVRVTSDCPLIDGNCIKEAVEQYQNAKSDKVYLSNCEKRTFPRGFDFEIFSMSLLREAEKNARSQEEREHVTPYIRKNPQVTKKNFLSDQDMSQFRLTVDEADDFRLIQELIENYDAAEKNYTEICKILNANPELAQYNLHVQQKKT